MTTETTEYKEKRTTHFTSYYHYKGGESVMSLQRSIDAVQREVFAMTDKVEEELPLFKWSIGHDNEQKAVIFRVEVSIISSRLGWAGSGTPIVSPIPPPPPHHPKDSDFDLVNPDKLGKINFI